MRSKAASDASKHKGAPGARAVRLAARPRGRRGRRAPAARAQAVRAEAARALAGWLLADAAGAVADAEAAALALPALPPGARAHHLQAAAAALGAVLG